MGNGSSIGSRGPAPHQPTTNTTDVEAPSTPASPPTTDQKKIQGDPQSTGKTSISLKQQGTERISQQNIAGNLKQRELNQNLGKASPQIDVRREKTADGIRTTYPSGMTIETSGKKDTGKGVVLEAGRTIQPPPGGTLEEKPGGRILVMDAQGKKVATIDEDKEGTLHVYTKQGEHTERLDGSIGFTKGKSEPPAPPVPDKPTVRKNQVILDRSE